MTRRQVDDQLFVGNGEMAMLMRSCDWSQTKLGSLSSWAPSLKTAVSICLNSRFPMVIWWGKDLVLLYNDAWKPILGTKHPAALGRPGQEVWSEIWDVIGVQLHSVLDTAQATWSDDILLLVDRHGYTEEAYFTYSYSPIFLETGEVGGAFTAVTETTRRVIGERRLTTLRELAASTVAAKSVEETCRIACMTLTNNPYDIPIALLYLLEQDGNQARLVGTVRIEAGASACPEWVDLTQADDDWRLSLVSESGNAEIIDDLVNRFGILSGGAWDQPLRSAIVLPIAQAGQKQQLAGLLVLGISPRCQFDDECQGFFDLVASNVATGIADARAFEEERKRAEALAELDRAKTTFFSNVSHEFRTPLTLMLSPLEELSQTLEGRLQPDEQQQLELIQRNGSRLQKLVNTLLDFSRIEADRVQATYEPTDLANFTAELASTFRSLIERAGLALQIDCPTLLEPVYVDREMWEKIVLNLLSNAFKFTFTGGITVRLRSLGQTAELSVEDTGVGIPEAELSQIFKRFHRVSETRSRTYEGSGIGLTLVQELVKLHGGTIQVTSQVNCGTTFTIALPLGSTHLPQDRIRANLTLIPTALRADSYIEEASRWLPETGNEHVDEWKQTSLIESASCRAIDPSVQQPRILLVDDNADMRGYVKRLLSQRWHVEAVSDGLEALAAIAQHPPDLVLSDVMMPKLDGFGLLHALHTHANTKEIPLILLSARAGEESRIEGLEAGADDYLTKPFSARELLASVESNLKLAQLRRKAMQQEQLLRLEAETAKQQVETILSGINDAFYVLDRNWCFTYVNNRLCEIVGMEREQLLGCSIWDLFPDTIDTDVYVQFHQAFHEQTPIHAEYFYTTWNRWYNHRIYPSPNGLTVLGSDITDHKQIEAELRESEARFRQMADTAPVFIWMSNTDSLCYYFNQPWLDFTGRMLEQEMGNGWTEGVHPDDFETCLATYITAFNARQPFQMEYRLKRFDGVYRWIVDSAVPRFTPEGDFLGYIGSCIDIEDRKQVEVALHQSEERYRYLAEMIPQLVWTADANSVLIDINQRWSDFTGLTLAQAQVEGWKAVVHPDDLPTLSQNWAAAQQGIHYRAEGRMRRADGAYLWHLHEAIPLKNEQGQVIKWFGTATDIESRKQLEYQRQYLLEQEQAAREQAETANRIKDEFLAVLSHELRSPLNPILGWSKLLRAGRLNPAQTAQALETIERNAKLQTQLIEDLLDVSRILQGKLNLNIVCVNLVSTIKAALETVRLAAEAKSIQIQTLLDPLAEQVLGDPVRLQQVIWNLLSNAVKFTPEGGRVEVRLSWVTGADNAQIRVSDTGKGIHPDFLPYVFEYFRQEDGKTTRKFGGLGLGLAIVRHLVELHGGTVQAESPGEDQGSTFIVRLPLMKGKGKTQQIESSRPSSPAYTSLLAGLRLLLVDDDVDARNLITLTLEQSGAIVTTVTSATEALQVFTQNSFDLLISDIAMPEIDGYMLIQQIRAMPPEQGGEILAIALTAYAGEHDQQRSIAAGFQQHISKPVEPNELINAIHAVCVSRLTRHLP